MFASDVPHPAPLRATSRGRVLWLARHAEVHPDWQGRAYGDLDVPLSEEGERETSDLGQAFGRLTPRPRLVLSSPLRRALVLGQGIAASTGARLDERPELREIHRGTWQGRTVEELYEREPDAVRAFYDDPWSFRAHGGESDADVLARATPLVEQADGEGAPIVVTTHYNVIRVLVAAALAIPAARSFAFRVDPGRLVRLAEEHGTWRLSRGNVARPDPLEAVSALVPGSAGSSGDDEDAS